jgi:hypothetical protein
LATVDATGLLTATGFACASALISATLQTNHSIGNLPSSGAMVTSFMTASLLCFTRTGPALTVNFADSSTGTISNSLQVLVVRVPAQLHFLPAQQ